MPPLIGLMGGSRTGQGDIVISWVPVLVRRNRVLDSKFMRDFRPGLEWTIG